MQSVDNLQGLHDFGCESVGTGFCRHELVETCCLSAIITFLGHILQGKGLRAAVVAPLQSVDILQGLHDFGWQSVGIGFCRPGLVETCCLSAIISFLGRILQGKVLRTAVVARMQSVDNLQGLHDFEWESVGSGFCRHELVESCCISAIISFLGHILQCTSLRVKSRSQSRRYSTGTSRFRVGIGRERLLSTPPDRHRVEIRDYLNFGSHPPMHEFWSKNF